MHAESQKLSSGRTVVMTNLEHVINSFGSIKGDISLLYSIKCVFLGPNESTTDTKKCKSRKHIPFWGPAPQQKGC